MYGMDSHMHLIISEHSDFEHGLRGICSTQCGFAPGKVARSACSASDDKLPGDLAKAANATTRVTKATLE
jgi:hypothetical protein